jgi:hypothetical protein
MIEKNDNLLQKKSNYFLKKKNLIDYELEILEK